MESFILKLTEIPSTDCAWQLSLSPGLSVLGESSVSVPRPEPIPEEAIEPVSGGAATHIWEIKAMAQGIQQLKGSYTPVLNTTVVYKEFNLKITNVPQNITSRKWDFGDGTYSTELNPTHVYSTPGIYTSNLTLNNVNVMSSKTALINVWPETISPSSGFGEVTPGVGGGSYAYITNQYDNTISVINTTTDTVTATVNVGSNPIGVAVSPDGKKVYSANYYSNTISAINTANNKLTATLNLENPKGIAVSPDGKQVYVLSPIGVYIIDTTTNKLKATVKIGNYPEGIAVSPDGKKVYVSRSLTDVVVIDTETNTMAANFYANTSPWGVAVTPDGKKLYVTNNYDNTVSIFDTATNYITSTVDVGSNPQGVAINPAGTNVYVTNYNSNTVSVIDTATNNVIATVPVGSGPNGIAITSDGKKVYVVNQNSNNVSVIDTATNIVVATMNVGNYPSAFGQFIGFIPAVYSVKNSNNNVQSDVDSSHDNGGSGGGGGGSPEPQSNVEVKELSQTFIRSGNSAKFDFLNSATSVVYVSFDSKKTAGKITTTIEMLKNKSSLSSDTPASEIYKYLNIWVGNSGFATSNNIENAIVCFKVEKSWVQDKMINKSSITLNRYSDNKWNPLPTNLSGEDDKYLYFAAKTPGFSPFAITGKTTASEVKTQLVTTNEIQNRTQTGNGTVSFTQSHEQMQRSNNSGKENEKTPGFEMVYGITCVFAVFLHKISKIR